MIQALPQSLYNMEVTDSSAHLIHNVSHYVLKKLLELSLVVPSVPNLHEEVQNLSYSTKDLVADCTHYVQKKLRNLPLAEQVESTSLELDAQDLSHSLGSNDLTHYVQEKLQDLPLAIFITKLLTRTDQLSLYGTKLKIETIDQESTILRKNRLQCIQTANNKEKACKRWSVMAKVFSWLGTVTTIVCGIALIASGAGIAAGAPLLLGGFLSITNHLLEITGGWNHIAMKLGAESEKTRSIIMWIQISITSMSLVLAGVGAIFGGMAAIKEAVNTAGVLFGGVANAGVGTLMISIAILNRDFYLQQSKIKRYEMQLEEYRQERNDLVDTIEEHAKKYEDSLLFLMRIMKMSHRIAKTSLSLR